MRLGVTCFCTLLSLTLAPGLVGVAAAQPAKPDAQTRDPWRHEPAITTRTLAQTGVQSFKDGKYEEAVDQLTRANAEFPAPQYLLYLGRSLVRLKRLVEARQAFAGALAMTAPAGAPEDFVANFRKAQDLATADLAMLLQTIPLVRARVSGPPVTAVRVTSSSGLVWSAPGEEDLDVASNPGRQVLRFEASGFEPVEVTFEATERAATGLASEITITLRSSAPRPAPVEKRWSPAPAPGDDQAASGVPFTLSHRYQIGAFARADVDAINVGARAAAGLSFGVHDFVEPYVAALLGPHVGVEPGVTGYLRRGAWKPMLQVAVPMFVKDGLYPGLRAAAGLQWDVNRHFGAFLLVGGAYFFDPPSSYAQLVLVPSIGIQGRL